MGLWRLIACTTVALVAAACSASQVTPTTTLREHPPVYFRVLVGDVNAEYNNNHNQSSPPVHFRLVPASTRVAMSEATAVRAVITSCNEGRGAQVVSAGLVAGAVSPGSDSSALAWAIFVDPPGRHIAFTTAPTEKPEIVNWYAGFVSVKTTRQPFCTFGRAANIPRLPILGVPGQPAVPTVDTAATPAGWVPVDFGDSQVSVPASFSVFYPGQNACEEFSTHGALLVAPTMAKMLCPSSVNTQTTIVRLVPMHQVPPPYASEKPTILDGESVFLGPNGVTLLGYYAPSLGVEVIAKWHGAPGRNNPHPFAPHRRSRCWPRSGDPDWLAHRHLPRGVIRRPSFVANQAHAGQLRDRSSVLHSRGGTAGSASDPQHR